jgi:flagellar biosynthesis/type III secretory pathway M-ring protein FliF/YscJ
MYIYNSQGQKVPVVENFGFDNKPQRIRENYSSESKKKTMNIVLAILGVIVALVLVYILYKYMSKPKAGMGFRKRFGFRFY